MSTSNNLKHPSLILRELVSYDGKVRTDIRRLHRCFLPLAGVTSDGTDIAYSVCDLAANARSGSVEHYLRRAIG
jgi:hypothetical protein